MAIHSTNSLLDLCRFGISLKNELSDTAARELASYIVAFSVLETNTDLPDVMEQRVVLLNDAKADFDAGTGRYPQDIFDEEELPEPDDTGPQVA